jgi:hypothetical protein
MLGMKGRSYVQGLPTQKIQSEDYAHHPRGYTIRRYGKSNMIEVEGKIINQPVAILIYSGASHCYIDPKILDRLHLEKSKLGKSSLV